MQMLVDGLRQRRTDARRATEVLDARAQDTLQAAEMPQQRASPRRPEAGDAPARGRRSTPASTSAATARACVDGR
jgi:hypothetical protein